jgi:hypothetical protein
LSERRIPPAGDPFHLAGRDLKQDYPHACIEGRVFLSYTVLDPEAGEEVERIENLPCRRCIEEGEE